LSSFESESIESTFLFLGSSGESLSNLDRMPESSLFFSLFSWSLSLMQ